MVKADEVAPLWVERRMAGQSADHRHGCSRKRGQEHRRCGQMQVGTSFQWFLGGKAREVTDYFQQFVGPPGHRMSSFHPVQKENVSDGAEYFQKSFGAGPQGANEGRTRALADGRVGGRTARPRASSGGIPSGIQLLGPRVADEARKGMGDGSVNGDD